VRKAVPHAGLTPIKPAASLCYASIRGRNARIINETFDGLRPGRLAAGLLCL